MVIKLLRQGQRTHTQITYQSPRQKLKTDGFNTFIHRIPIDLKAR